MKDFKTIEEIRLDQGKSQIVWADMIGTTFRTYQGRLSGVQPKWTLQEIILASSYNDGRIIVPTPNGDYKVTIEKVE